MSPDPNSSSHSPKSASSAHSRTEAQANPAPEPSSPAEPMTDPTPKSVLVPPPTRIPPEAASAAQPAPDPATASKATSQPSTSVPPLAPKPTATQPLEPAEPPAEPQEPQASQPAQPQPDAVKPDAVASEPEITAEAEPAPETAPETVTPAALRQQPIPPASEPMQYRAIGLVRGKYMPSEEQFTRGFILTDDEVLIDAVLLGRVMSLVKKHIDLGESHLWVVYPRTREKDLELHMQIVGVWEPDRLNRSSDEPADADSAAPDAAVSESDADAAELDAAEANTAEADTATPDSATPDSVTAEPELPVSTEDLDDCYFSVRGEVVYQSDEEDRLLVKIRRAPKPGETEGKAFKVALKGKLQGKALGYFWDMQVQRQNSDLLITEAVQIGMVPPQKRGAGSRGSRPPRRGAGGPPRRGAGGPPKRRWDNQGGGRDGGREGGRDSKPYRSERPIERSGERSSERPSAPRQPISKPVKRQKEEPS